jgi:hypothetical protein
MGCGVHPGLWLPDLDVRHERFALDRIEIEHEAAARNVHREGSGDGGAIGSIGGTGTFRGVMSPISLIVLRILF